MRRLMQIFVGLLLAAGPAVAQDCNAPTPDPIVHLALPGNPFTPAISADGCWIYVALAGQQGATQGVAVIRRGGGKLNLVRTIPLKTGGTGATLTHDGKMFIVAAGTNVAFVDVSKIASGGEPSVGYLDFGDPVGAIYANTTRDDALLFVALERATSILVIDLAKVRRGGKIDESVVLGRIPTGSAPIAVTLSNDEKYLYSTSQSQVPSWGWPLRCKPEAQAPNVTEPVLHSMGAVMVIDVSKVRTDAAHSVVSSVPVGCNPVRLVLSPDGNTAWVTARGDHSLVSVDVKKLVDDPAHAVIRSMRVGTAPVGMAIFDNGRKIAATNSNRFEGGANDTQSINIVDISGGPFNPKLIGLIPAGAFPRELRTSPDGNTLYASNFVSWTLEVVDLQRLPIKK